MIGVERLAQLTAKISKFANALKQGVLSVVKVGRKVIRGMSSDDFLKLFKNEKLAAEAFGHWKNKDWSKLEDLFRKNGINDGWPPNRGFVQSKTTTLNPGKQIDRYGGRTNPLTGKFEDGGGFVANKGEDFGNREYVLFKINFIMNDIYQKLNACFFCFQIKASF